MTMSFEQSPPLSYWDGISALQVAIPSAELPANVTSRTVCSPCIDVTQIRNETRRRVPSGPGVQNASLRVGLAKGWCALRRPARLEYSRVYIAVVSRV
jgi:hypothetical protein